MVGVELWAEVRRLHFVRGLSIHEIHRRTGLHRETIRRWVLRVAPDPYLRFDTCDYSLDPRLVGRRVEARVSDREVLAVALDSG